MRSATLLPLILQAGEAYGDATVGAGTRVNVEYVSANPTGPMHIGHCRGAVVGDALANLLAKAGYDVTKEYYINDAGAQVTALAWAAYWRYLQAIGTLADRGGIRQRGPRRPAIPWRIPGSGRPGAGGKPTAPASPTTDLGIAAPEDWLDTVRDFTIAAMMAEIREDLRLLGVQQDVFSSERALVTSGAADAMIDRLHCRRPDLRRACWNRRRARRRTTGNRGPQTLFRSTQFGDDVDRPLRKSDGSNTYFANDIAYHADKVGRGFDVLIDVLGADHGGYVARMRAAVKAISGAPGGVRGGALPDRPHHARRPAGADVQARRHLRHAARPAGGGRHATPSASPC